SRYRLAWRGFQSSPLQSTHLSAPLFGHGSWGIWDIYLVRIGRRSATPCGHLTYRSWPSSSLPLECSSTEVGAPAVSPRRCRKVSDGATQADTERFIAPAAGHIQPTR